MEKEEYPLILFFLCCFTRAGRQAGSRKRVAEQTTIVAAQGTREPPGEKGALGAMLFLEHMAASVKEFY